jgi:protein AroM
VPLIAPQEALYATVRAVAGRRPVGSLTPLERQVAGATKRWQAQGVTVPVVRAADPYCSDPIAAVASAASELREAGAGVCFLDCFGFDLAMRDAARSAFGGPVVLARSLAARFAAEVM